MRTDLLSSLRLRNQPLSMSQLVCDCCVGRCTAQKLNNYCRLSRDKYQPLTRQPLTHQRYRRSVHMINRFSDDDVDSIYNRLDQQRPNTGKLFIYDKVLMRRIDALDRLKQRNIREDEDLEGSEEGSQTYSRRDRRFTILHLLTRHHKGKSTPDLTVQ